MNNNASNSVNNNTTTDNDLNKSITTAKNTDDYTSNNTKSSPIKNVISTATTKIVASPKLRRRDSDRDDINRQVSDISDIERVDVKMKTRNGVFEIESVDFKMKTKKHLLKIATDEGAETEGATLGGEGGNKKDEGDESLLAMFEAVANQDIAHIASCRSAPPSLNSSTCEARSRDQGLARSCLKIRQTCQLDTSC